MRFIARVLLTGLAVFLIATLMPGVQVKDMNFALLVGLVLTLLNVFIKPILIFLTLPITLVTLGLFLLVINALIVMLAAKLIPQGFIVDGFWVALFFSIVLSMATSLLDTIFSSGSKSQENKGFN